MLEMVLIAGVKNNYSYNLLSTRYVLGAMLSKYFSHCSLNVHDNLMKMKLSCNLKVREVSHLLRINQLVSGGARIGTQIDNPPKICS